MKKLHFIPMLLIMLASCTAELEQMPADTDYDAPKRVFHASIEGAVSASQTKVYADEDMKVLWNAGDMISIYEKTTYNHPYQFDGDDGDTAGDFIDQTPSGFHTGNAVPYYYAAYPYSKSNKLSNQGVFTLTFPAEQSYKANSFGIGANTMVAVTDNDFLAFKNAGGYLSLRLYGDGISVSKVTLKANNGEKISGKGMVTIPLGEVPDVEMDATATDEITIVCEPAVKIGADADNFTSFWFVIPPVTFEKGFTVTVTDDKDGDFSVSTSKSITVTRNKLDWMAALKVVPNYTNAAVKFTDPDFEAYCLQNFDTNEDGVLSRSEAAAVEEIDVCTDNISSLDGIEYFTGLKSLSCTGTEAVATKSSSTQYNGQLESIDVGSCILLEELDCHGNKIDDIDVTNNPELNTLICTDNPVTTIHLAPGQVIPTLESPEDTQIVHEWDEGLGPESFPDPEFRAYVFENFDTDDNGFLSEAECDAVGSINVNSENIYTLQGIEFFHNLKNLYCKPDYSYATNPYADWHLYDSEDNEVIGSLTTLDISHNPSLQYLCCEGNQLTSIDLSNNSSLLSLYCTYNQLTSLDLSANPLLRYLHCDRNQLTSLNVSNNTALTELVCDVNQLSSLDIQNNTALRGLQCGSNQLTNLNVSNNTSLTYLESQSNKLTDIDLSNNTALTSLWLMSNNLSALDVTHNPELSTVRCDYNQITSLDLSNNTKLTDLNCGNNSLLELDVTHNTLLKSLHCQSNRITSLDLSYNTALNDLSCNHNSLIQLDVSANTSLTRLWCNYCDLTSLDISNNTALTGLWCFNNRLTSLDVSNNPALTSLSCSNSTMQYLYLSEGQEIASLSKHNNTAIVYKSSGPAADEIWYTSSNGDVVNPKLSGTGGFGDASVVSNTYTDGKGVLKFDRPLTTIGYSVFGFADFTSVTLPEGLTTIESYAFGYCQRMTSITFPSTLTSIGAHAIRDCYSLTTVTIPNSVETIGAGAFDNCMSLQSFSGKYASSDHRWLIVDGSLVGFAPSGLTSITIPSGVTEIETYTFHNCSDLTSVTIPEGVTRIGGSAFAGCSSLTTVSIPESMETIESGAFSECHSMSAFNGKFASEDGRCLVVNGTTVGFAPVGVTDYTIPSSVTNVAYSTFEYCTSLTTITVPASVTRIGEYAFRGCSSLTAIIFDSTVPPTLNTIQVPTAIFDDTNNCPIYVPASAVDTYKNAGEAWGRYADRIQPRAALPEAVDLGLSVKWASFNVGASKPEENGDYFAWGETRAKEEYSWDTYKLGKGTSNSLTKYCNDSQYGNNGYTDDLSYLLPGDDAATVNLGGNWRMPTDEESWELSNNTTISLTEINGITVFELKSKINGNVIYFPIAGYRKETPGVYDGGLYRGFYWCSRVDHNRAYDGYNFCLSNDAYYSGSSADGCSFGVYTWATRYKGYTVRPVTD